MRLRLPASPTAILCAILATCSFGFESEAFAQDPAPAKAPAVAPPVASLPAAPAANEACVVDRFVGVTKDDAEAVEQIVCAEVASQLPYGGHYRIRIAKLGGKIVLTLIGEKSSGGHAEKQLVLSGLDEVPVAAPRLAEALVDQKHVVETQTVTNIVGDEARTHKKKTSEVHFWIGMVGAATTEGQGAGAHLGLSAGSERWSFVGDLRAAGSAFTDPAAVALEVFSLGMLEPKPKDKAGFASLSGGVRHHFSASDTSVFMGGGIALDYLKVSKADGKVGMAGFVEIGVDLLRTHTVGGAFALRVDAPAFAMTEKQYAADGYPSSSSSSTSSSSSYYAPTSSREITSYVPVVGADVSLRF